MFSPEATELITKAARHAGLHPAALMAVIEVETSGKMHAVVRGRREPLIRFEGHYFDRRLSPQDRKRAREEGLAAPSAGAVRNPPGQTARWRMLERAVEIDRRAAYESTSWGVGQVMGAHWAWLGYESVDALVAQARSGPAGQIDLMLRYIAKAGLMEALRRRDWPAFARGYNGPAYARNNYHLRLSLAFRRHARLLASGAGPLGVILRRRDHGPAVRRLQKALHALGYATAVDGIFGPQTEEMVRRFQRDQGLDADGIFGPETMERMGGAAAPAGFRHIVRRALASIWTRVQALWVRPGV